jgi:hypothetical protein
MFRISTLIRGALLAAAVALCSVPSLASAHNGYFPTVSYCQPYCNSCYSPCYRPLIVSQPLFYSQPVVVQPCARPVIVTPYVQTYGQARIIVR